MDTPSNEQKPTFPHDIVASEEFQEVRRFWNEEEQVWYYAIVDLLPLLVDTKNPNVYWSAFKKRHSNDAEFRPIFQNIKEYAYRSLKDNKLRPVECATRRMMLRIIQSLPGEKGEHVRLWLAATGEEKLQEIEQQDQAQLLIEEYIQQGRSPEWAKARVENLVGRNALTDEWLERGAVQSLHFGKLSYTIHLGTFDISPSHHHTVVKQLPKSVKNPRDHYTEGELIVLTASEYAARQRGINNDSQGINQLMDDAHIAGAFGGQVRRLLEEATGKPVVSSTNFLDQSKPKRRQKHVSDPEQQRLLPE